MPLARSRANGQSDTVTNASGIREASRRLILMPFQCGNSFQRMSPADGNGLLLQQLDRKYFTFNQSYILRPLLSADHIDTVV